MSQINQLVGSVASYPSFMANPAVPLVRYLLQKMLGKFLKNGISLTPADFSMADISLNNLEFDCQVLNQCIGNSSNVFKIVQFDVKNLTLKNWMSPATRSPTSEGVKIIISDVDILFVPLLEPAPERKDQQPPTDNQSQAQSRPRRPVADLQPRDMQSIDERLAQIQAESAAQNKDDSSGSSGYLAGLLNEMMTWFFRSLEVEIRNLNIRIMTRDQDLERLDDVVPTFFVHATEISLLKDDATWEHGKGEGDQTELLLDGKRARISELSVHLMPARPLAEAHPEQRSHPSAIVLWMAAASEGSTRRPALDISFSYASQQMNMTAQIAEIEAILGIEQLKEILKFQDHVAMLKAVRLDASGEAAVLSENGSPIVPSEETVPIYFESREEMLGQMTEFIELEGEMDMPQRRRRTAEYEREPAQTDGSVKDEKAAPHYAIRLSLHTRSISASILMSQTCGSISGSSQGEHKDSHFVTDSLYAAYNDKAFKVLRWPSQEMDGTAVASPLFFTLSLDEGMSLQYYSGRQIKSEASNGTRQRKLNIKGNPFGAELIERRQQKLAEVPRNEDLKQSQHLSIEEKAIRQAQDHGEVSNINVQLEGPIVFSYSDFRAEENRVVHSSEAKAQAEEVLQQADAKPPPQEDEFESCLLFHSAMEIEDVDISGAQEGRATEKQEMIANKLLIVPESALQKNRKVIFKVSKLQAKYASTTPKRKLMQQDQLRCLEVQLSENVQVNVDSQVLIFGSYMAKLLSQGRAPAAPKEAPASSKNEDVAPIHIAIRLNRLQVELPLPQHNLVFGHLIDQMLTSEEETPIDVLEREVFGYTLSDRAPRSVSSPEGGISLVISDVEVYIPKTKMRSLLDVELSEDWLEGQHDVISRSTGDELAASTLSIRAGEALLVLQARDKATHTLGKLQHLKVTSFQTQERISSHQANGGYEGAAGIDEGNQADDRSSDEENFIIYEDDDDVDQENQQELNQSEQQQEHQLRVGMSSYVVKHSSIEIGSLRAYFPMIHGRESSRSQTLDALDVAHLVENLDTFFKSLQAFNELVRVLPVQEDDLHPDPDEHQQQQDQIVSEISTKISKFDLFVTKARSHTLKPLLQTRIENVELRFKLGDASLTPEDQKEKSEVAIKLGNLVVLDYCQQNYKLYNLMRARASIFSMPEGATISPELDQLETLSLVELLQTFEYCILVHKHSSFLEQNGKTKRDLLEAKLNLCFDVSRKHVFSGQTLRGIRRQTGFQLDLEEPERLQQLPVQLYELFVELQINPMALKGQLTLRDVAVRAQPLLSQKMDELSMPRREKFNELNVSIYSYQESELLKSRDSSCFMATSLLHELYILQQELSRGNSSKKREGRKLDAAPIRKRPQHDQINFEFKVQNLACDFHPVVRFEQYMEIFGGELEKDRQSKGFHYPRFDAELKFRQSQRLVLSIKEIYCEVTWHQKTAFKSISTAVESLSLQALDQSRYATSENLNPQSFCPGMPTSVPDSQRYPLFLLDGTPGLSSSTYLESLGFKKILLFDHFDVQISFEIMKNIRKGTSLPDQNRANEGKGPETYVPEVHDDSDGLDDLQASVLYETAYAAETSRDYKDPHTGHLKFEKFRVQTKIKKILSYLTQDSLRTVKQAVDGLQANSLQFIPAKAAMRNDDGPKSSLQSQNADEEDPSDLSSVLELVMKEHGYLESSETVTTLDPNSAGPRSANAPSRWKDQNGQGLEEFQMYEDTSLSTQLNKGNACQDVSPDDLSNFIFQINQIDLHRLQHFGCKHLDLSRLMREDYVPLPRSETTSGQRFRRQHQPPRIEVGKAVTTALGLEALSQEEQGPGELTQSIVISEHMNPEEIEPDPKKELDPYAYLQPKVSLFLHLQTLDVKLFQGTDFDFRDQFADPSMAGCILTADIEKHFQAIGNLGDSHSRSGDNHANADNNLDVRCNVLGKSTRIVDTNYFQTSTKPEGGPVAYNQPIKNPYLHAQVTHTEIIHSEYLGDGPKKEHRFTELNLRRKRGQQRGCYYQILLKNIHCSSYRMKNALFKKRDEILEHTILRDICHKVLYKYDRRALSIQKVFIKENISTRNRGRVLVDTFHLPYTYKYDNFCEFLCYQENYVKYKTMGLRAELQPFKLKLRQDGINFAVDFLQWNSASEGASDQSQVRPEKQEAPQIDGGLDRQDDALRQVDQTGPAKSKKKEKVPVFMKELHVRETHMSLSYSSQTFSINELVRHGNKMEYLNIFNIHDLTMLVRPYDLQKKKLVLQPEALKQVTEFYVEDLARQNPSMNLLGALGPVRSLCRVGSAVWGVVWRPIEGGVTTTAGRADDRGQTLILPEFDAAGMVKGMARGVSELVFVLGDEGANVRNKVWRAAGGVADGVSVRR